MKALLKILLTMVVVGVFLALAPQSAEAASNKKAQGHILDQNRLGINGVEVELRFYRLKGANETDCQRDPEITDPNLCKIFTSEPVRAVTKNDPYDGTGPGWYELEPPCGDIKFFLFAKAPGSSDFALVEAPSGVSWAVGSPEETKVLAATSGKVCRVVKGHQPGTMVDNVMVGGDKTETICDDQPKTPEPKVCNGDCTLTDTTACQGAGGESCRCVDQGNGAGKCQVCPTGTTYNPTTKKCEPPAKVCNGDCNLTDTTACQGAGGESCKCVDQGGGKGACQVCPTGTVYNPTTKKCEPPVTPPPACNGACDLTNSTACQAGGQGCRCVDQGNGTGACQVCPTGTTYNAEAKKCLPPPACNVSCVSDSYCNSATDGCTACLPNGSGGKTCQKPFNENMCQCDGIDIGGKIVPGQKSTFVAYAKVMGTDQNLAQVQSLAFHVAQDNKVIYDSNPVSVEVVSKDANMTRYKATFSYTFPANINTKSIYRVYVDSPKCSQKTAMVIEPETTAVLGTTACVDPRSGAEQLWDSARSIFTGVNYDPCAQANLDALDQTSRNASTAPTSSAATNLQLQTFGDATVTDKSCRFVFFRFQQ